MSGKFIGDIASGFIKGMASSGKEQQLIEEINTVRTSKLLFLHNYRWIFTVACITWTIIALVVYYQQDTEEGRSKVQYTNNLLMTMTVWLCLTWVVALSLTVIIPTINSFMLTIIDKLLRTVT